MLYDNFELYKIEFFVLDKVLQVFVIVYIKELRKEKVVIS